MPAGDRELKQRERERERGFLFSLAVFLYLENDGLFVSVFAYFRGSISLIGEKWASLISYS